METSNVDIVATKKYDFPFAAFNLNLVQGLKTTKTEQDTSSGGGDKVDYSFDDVAL